ncbi:MAG: SCO family protein [Ignavibacterium sp.]|nr:SCO family protein [Ignavibacterium sp.]MCX7612211.1 SCO family protein [Ignavibacterium sp.]MDW8375600.1 SCO family protein [Ignavibacteriales bacterium]
MKKIFLLLFVVLCFNVFPDEKQEVGVNEKLGNNIPLNVQFFDEDSNQVSLSDLIKKPTVLAFVYYECPGICSPLLSSLAEAIDNSDLVLGVDYNVIVISMDELETPKNASKRKNVIIQLMDKNVPPGSWRFLTGNLENIKKVSDAAGFYFKREGKDFRHAGCFIFLDPSGKITRYLFPSYSERHGFGVLPFDFKMAILEASESKVTPTIARVLQFCYSYDPVGRTYVFNITRVFGIIILILVIAFLIYIKFSKRIISNKN